MANVPVYLSGQGVAQTANTTYYLTLGDSGLNSNAALATVTESQAQVTWRTAGIFSLLRISVSSNSATLSPTTLTLRQNSASPAGGPSVSISAGARMGGRVHLGRGTFIGTGSIVLPRTTIGAGSIVAAGSVVTRDVPEGVLVMGIPARVRERVDGSFEWKRLL